MNDGLIARRYAKAFLKYADDKNAAAVAYGQMKQLDEAYAATPRLRRAVGNRFISAADKQQLLLAAAGAAPGDCLAKFISLVIDHNREGYMREMSKAYQDLYRKDNGIAQVEIVTAAPMGADTLKRITDVVGGMLRGKTVEQTHRIDPSLIGGFVVRVDTVQLDASIKNELKKLRLKLLRN